MFDLTELALGAAVAAIVVHLCHIRRADADMLRLYADLRSERAQSAAQDAQLAEQDARLAEQDAQLAHAAHELAQAQGREALAAANILQLSGALMNAAAQARKPAANVPPAMTLWLN